MSKEQEWQVATCGPSTQPLRWPHLKPGLWLPWVGRPARLCPVSRRCPGLLIRPQPQPPCLRGPGSCACCFCWGWGWGPRRPYPLPVRGRSGEGSWRWGRKARVWKVGMRSQGLGVSPSEGREGKEVRFPCVVGSVPGTGPPVLGKDVDA